MLHVTPFLLFDGNCAEAMAFYKSCFGGELMLTRLGDTPMKDSLPPVQHGRITYAHLKSGAVELSGTDWLHPSRMPVRGNMTAIYVSGEADELKPIFGRLSEKADTQTFVPLAQMPFGLYGRMTDRFGVEWFFRGEN